MVNFPHNPAGYVPSESDFDRLIGLARKYDLWLFCDEISRGLGLDSDSFSCGPPEKAIVHVVCPRRMVPGLKPDG